MISAWTAVVSASSSPEIINSRMRLQAGPVWEMIEFLLNGLVFILIGLSLHGILDRMGGRARVWHQAIPLAVASVLAVIGARFLWIFLASLVRRTVMPGIRASDPLIATSVLTVLSTSSTARASCSLPAWVKFSRSRVKSET